MCPAFHNVLALVDYRVNSGVMRVDARGPDRARNQLVLVQFLKKYERQVDEHSSSILLETLRLHLILA